MGFKVLILGAALCCMGARGQGCGGIEQDEELTSELTQLAEDAGQSNGAADTANALVSIAALTLSSADKVSSAASATTAAEGVGTFFKPAGCVTATKSVTTVTYEFQGCTGPWGLVGVNGKLVAIFSPIAGGVQAKINSDGLKLGNTPVEQSATLKVTFKGSVRTVTWNGGYKGVTNVGKKSIQHTASYTNEFDTSSGCVSSDGNGDTTVEDRGLAVTVSGYKRCGDLWVCPDAGKITATGKKTGLSLTLEYLGAGRARITVPSGKSWDYKMLWCVAK